MMKLNERKQNYKFYNIQIDSYKNRIQDLESNIEIHQHLVLSLLQSKHSELTTESTTSISSKQFESLIHENITLYKGLRSSYQDLTLAQSRSFLSEQIHNDLIQKLNEISAEYSEKITEYTFSLDVKKKVIYELEDYNKRLSENILDYVHGKFIEVVQPREDILEIYSKVEWMKEKIQELARTCFVAGEFKEILLEFVKKLTMSQQLVQALLKNPINRKPGADRVHFNSVQEVPEESSDSSESSEVEVSEINRAATVSKQSSVVPKIDFSRISKVSIHTEQPVPKSGAAIPQMLKELKSLYKSLNSSISAQSLHLEALSKENFRLQQQNVSLTQSLISIPAKSRVSGLEVIEEEV